MSIRLSSLTVEDVAAARGQLPRAFSATPQERVKFWIFWGANGALTLYCLYRFGFLSGDFLHGMAKFGSVVVAQLFPPAGWGHMPEFLKAMGETIAMAFIGTLLGAVFALPLSFLASRNMTRSRPVQFGTRRFADLLRAFDYLIWALIFVRAVGLGPLAGIMAIAIVETGTFIKLYSEAIENLDRKQVDGIAAAGGNGLQRIRFGVLPQVLPVMLAQALYFFESNTRSAAILGVVGAGGIGLQIAERIRVRHWDEVAFIILLMIATVAAIDWLSARLRRRLIGGR